MIKIIGRNQKCPQTFSLGTRNVLVRPSPDNSIPRFSTELNKNLGMIAMSVKTI